MSIKLGNLNVESFKVGSGDCSIYLGTTLLYSGGTPPAPHDYSQDYLTFRALEDGTFKFSGNSINYSTDSGSTWTKLASNTDSPTVNSGDTILWKASLTASSNGIGKFSSTGQFEVEGNIMSLKYGDNFSGQITLSDNYSLANLFSGCSGVTSAENMVLPATTLTEYCYRAMFKRCTSLTTAPALPATTLAIWCYFWMFRDCTSLNSITCLATDISAKYCTSNWVNGVAASGTFTTPSSTQWSTGNSGIPTGWTRVDYSS